MIISILNMKGGVGKTTTTLNLGYALAQQGYKTLLIDNDPQGNLTTGIGIEEYEQTVTDTYLNGILPIHQLSEKLHVIPADITLSTVYNELSNKVDANFRLFKSLKAVNKDYDYILIDNRPDAGILASNSILARSIHVFS
ncbi:ParA family protein [Reichenbachiella ulvae]|uniref:AAA family ATPase n=1 Tax=Reichenbachiella ulvae TaxID=2980104 RepID=A0ABT3D0X7_9BACT|nr:AAA family ATPase [Reichenbachiella ulvae]MCV9389484.1 AAA family ATPase [Reichenbachiella ulvae]